MIFELLGVPPKWHIRKKNRIVFEKLAHSGNSSRILQKNQQFLVKICSNFAYLSPTVAQNKPKAKF
jgi:hypothetical protein